jgi:hypothetical protein
MVESLESQQAPPLDERITILRRAGENGLARMGF